MKHFLFILLLLLLIVESSFARKYFGYIVDIERDTIECHFLFNDLSKYKIGNELLSPKKIRIEVDKKKLTISPDLIISFSIKNEDKWETFWSVNTTRKEYMFMKLELKGTLNYYAAKTYDPEKKTYSNHTLLHQYKTKNKLYVVHGLQGNRAKLIRFLADCPIVQEKLKSKELRPERSDDLKRIIFQYNARCK